MRHAGTGGGGGKLSDGCNLLSGSVIGRVAGVMILGADSTSRSVPNGVHIWKQKMFQMGDAFGRGFGSKWVAHGFAKRKK